jgi:hypothetical protein
MALMPQTKKAVATKLMLSSRLLLLKDASMENRCLIYRYHRLDYLRLSSEPVSIGEVML